MQELRRKHQNERQVQMTEPDCSSDSFQLLYAHVEEEELQKESRGAFLVVLKYGYTSIHSLRSLIQLDWQIYQRVKMLVQNHNSAREPTIQRCEQAVLIQLHFMKA